jgi:hypothetical protein
MCRKARQQHHIARVIGARAAGINAGRDEQAQRLGPTESRPTPWSQASADQIEPRGRYAPRRYARSDAFAKLRLRKTRGRGSTRSIRAISAALSPTISQPNGSRALCQSHPVCA